MFFLLKRQNLECWPFYPTGTMSRITFEKRQCDRCRHRSAVKIRHPPPFHSQPPSLPPKSTHHPTTAQGQWYRAFGSCDLLGQWRGVPGTQHRNPLCSVPRPSPPPAQCRQYRLFQWRKRSLTLGRVRKRIHDMARNVSGKNRHSSWGETCSN